jgi:hypothetical protein
MKRVPKHGKDVFVGPHPKGGWQVKTAGSKKAFKRFDRKSDAVACGRALAKKKASELVVRTGDGVIKQKDSHGHDSRKTRG